MNRVQLTVACSVFCHLGNGVNSVRCQLSLWPGKGSRNMMKSIIMVVYSPCELRAKLFSPLEFWVCLAQAHVSEWLLCKNGICQSGLPEVPIAKLQGLEWLLKAS